MVVPVNGGSRSQASSHAVNNLSSTFLVKVTLIAARLPMTSQPPRMAIVQRWLYSLPTHPNSVTRGINRFFILPQMLLMFSSNLSPWATVEFDVEISNGDPGARHPISREVTRSDLLQHRPRVYWWTLPTLNIVPQLQLA